MPSCPTAAVRRSTECTCEEQPESSAFESRHVSALMRSSVRVTECFMASDILFVTVCFSIFASRTPFSSLFLSTESRTTPLPAHFPMQQTLENKPMQERAGKKLPGALCDGRNQPGEKKLIFEICVLKNEFMFSPISFCVGLSNMLRDIFRRVFVWERPLQVHEW